MWVTDTILKECRNKNIHEIMYCTYNEGDRK